VERGVRRAAADCAQFHEIALTLASLIVFAELLRAGRAQTQVTSR